MKKDLIRVGDLVRIVDPAVVVRVGYPKCPADYEEDARRKFGPLLHAERIPHHVQKKLIRELAYGLAKADHFGGRERTIHTRVDESLRGLEFCVREVRTAVTGTYFPPHTHASSWDDPYPDYDPGGLSGEKRHRIVSGWPNNPNPWFTLRGGSLMPITEPLEFLTTSLEKVTPAK